ncbi:MAG: GNAT family N-acetyltransferase [Eubacteriales bacterium]|nr:GNAT family N-acetyltransferase [Eubacteriales bacterium]MCI6028674.1 GNAT family N-acetyltransferase [Clostridiales bacterium]MDD7414219.1 GNAT family N-acetyltransferase [Clostridiales bacterium]MDY5732344.1 GNAT family N-acetyltransferase [Eubacteriales bacterium]
MNDVKAELTVRLAERNELEQVNVLRGQVNRLHSDARPDMFKAGFCDELKEYVYAFFDAEGRYVVVAECGGSICGFAMVERIVKPESPYRPRIEFMHIQEFGVDPAYRRMGAATRLIGFIKGMARAAAIDRIELDVWEFNKGAIEFYNAVGFDVCREYMELKL